MTVINAHTQFAPYIPLLDILYFRFVKRYKRMEKPSAWFHSTFMKKNFLFLKTHNDVSHRRNVKNEFSKFLCKTLFDMQWQLQTVILSASVMLWIICL